MLESANPELAARVGQPLAEHGQRMRAFLANPRTGAQMLSNATLSPNRN
jgi:hypothetical protein